jgi:ubiquinone/menaquinone biosynthesis C-methylase UbiE
MAFAATISEETPQVPPASLFEAYKDGLKGSLLPFLAEPLGLIAKDQEARDEAEKLLNLIASAFPDKPLIPWAVSATLRFNRMILEEERDFKRRGTYRRQRDDASFVNESVYQSHTVMEGYYLLGLLLTYLTWPHHQALLRFYRKRFLTPATVDFVMEWGTGHGLLSVLAAQAFPSAKLLGVDISPHSLAFTSSLLEAAGLASRCRFALGDVLQEPAPPEKAQRIICAEVLEHVSDPSALLRRLTGCLDHGGRAFLTAAINAAQADHIFHFRQTGEVTALIEKSGLEIVAAEEFIHPNRQGDDAAPAVLAVIAARA